MVPQNLIIRRGLAGASHSWIWGMSQTTRNLNPLQTQLFRKEVKMMRVTLSDCRAHLLKRADFPAPPAPNNTNGWGIDALVENCFIQSPSNLEFV